MNKSKDNKDLLEALQEIKDYEDGKIELESYKDVTELRNSLMEEVKLEPTEELVDALQEGEDILSGKVKTKGYHDVKQMFEDILIED